MGAILSRSSCADSSDNLGGFQRLAGRLYFVVVEFCRKAHFWRQNSNAMGANVFVSGLARKARLRKPKATSRSITSLRCSRPRTRPENLRKRPLGRDHTHNVFAYTIAESASKFERRFRRISAASGQAICRPGGVAAWRPGRPSPRRPGWRWLVRAGWPDRRQTPASLRSASSRNRRRQR
jgi:hypothetical protein